MDFSVVDTSTIKIKTKKASFLLAKRPPKGKIDTDALLLLKALTNIELGKELIIVGPGEYEIAGAKISVMRSGDNLFYMLRAENLSVCLAEAAAMNALKEKLDEVQVACVFSEALVEEAAITNLQPRVILCIGEKADEAAKLLMKDNASSEGASKTLKAVDKFSTTADKLPSEVQVILLG